MEMCTKKALLIIKLKIEILLDILDLFLFMRVESLIHSIVSPTIDYSIQ